jgi:hypothetical protein
MVARPPNGERACRRGAQDGALGSFPLLALGRSSADELSHSLTAARKRERRERVSARVRAKVPARFCSAGFHAWPLDADGRLTITGPSHGLGGKRLSRPRPTMSPGARSVLCASEPTGHFRFRAGFEL